MQVMQLEKMVKQMEEQQDRAQALRTRLEHRIAQLEMAAKGKNHRYVKEQSVPYLNLPNSLRNNSPRFLDPQALLQPTEPPNLQQLRLSPRNTIPRPSAKPLNKSWDSQHLNYHQSELSPRTYASFMEKRRESPRENGNHVSLLEGDGITKSPRPPRAVSPREALAYEMRESFYDWLMKPPKYPRKAFCVDPISRDEKLTKEYPECRRKQSQSSRESLFRGYKKRKFRAYRPQCDYQSPRKPTPTINVRRYTA